MFTFLPTANPSAPPPVQPAVFEGVPTQTQGSQRIPFYAVPANVNVVGPYNNTKPSAVVSGGAAVDEAPTATPTAQAAARNAARPAASTNSSTSSATLFLTQLMGQGGSSNLRLASSFFSNSFAPGDPELFDAYADVKYMPSLAGKLNRGAATSQAQQPLAQQGGSQLQRAEQARQASVQQQVQLEQARAQDGGLRMREPVAVGAQPSLIFGTVTRTTNERNLPALRNANDNEPVNLSNASLLGEGGGINAYLATSTRSAANITIPQPRFVFVE